jgi:hypothetical protein
LWSLPKEEDKRLDNTESLTEGAILVCEVVATFSAIVNVRFRTLNGQLDFIGGV